MTNSSSWPGLPTRAREKGKACRPTGATDFTRGERFAEGESRESVKQVWTKKDPPRYASVPICKKPPNSGQLDIEGRKRGGHQTKQTPCEAKGRRNFEKRKKGAAGVSWLASESRKPKTGEGEIDILGKRRTTSCADKWGKSKGENSVSSAAVLCPPQSGSEKKEKMACTGVFVTQKTEILRAPVTENCAGR